ncbi:hypothetical protein SLE2022_176020 [Rubroshorea leprosula]
MRECQVDKCRSDEGFIRFGGREKKPVSTLPRANQSAQGGSFNSKLQCHLPLYQQLGLIDRWPRTNELRCPILLILHAGGLGGTSKADTFDLD